MQIRGKEIGRVPYIIAEAGMAHEGELHKAKMLMHMAEGRNVDAFKTQFFYPDEVWTGDIIPDMATRGLSEEDILELARYTREHGMAFLCTAHDEKALQFVVEQAKVDAIKVGSGEALNFPYLHAVAHYSNTKGLPILISTGMSSTPMLKNTLAVLLYDGVLPENIAILYCVTSYPAKLSQVCIDQIRLLRNQFPESPIGFSDHTLGMSASIAAAAQGAMIFEKHIALSRDSVARGDASCAIVSSMGLADYVESTREAYQMSLSIPDFLTPEEISCQAWAFKSPYFKYALSEGTIIAPECFVMRRPFTGILGNAQYIFSNMRLAVDVSEMQAFVPQEQLRI